MSVSRYLTLRTQARIPALGFGTFANTLSSPTETHAAVTTALNAGYRHLDCAWFYGNEDQVGSAIRSFLSSPQGAGVTRGDLFVTTKVWNHLHEPEEVKWSLESSLERLGLEYVDLFLIHWPVAVERTEDYEPKIGSDGKYIVKKSLTNDPTPTWRSMEDIYTCGKARAIGVSNWTIPRLERLIEIARVKPHVNQVEIHPFLPNDAMLEFARRNDILLVAYSPLGSQGQVPTAGERVTENPAIIATAEKGGHSAPQMLIAWGIHRGYAVLPKSANEERIKSNFQVYEMNDEEFEAINNVARGRATRFVNMKDTFGYDVWANGEE